MSTLSPLPYTPAALVFVAELSKRWPRGDLEKILELAEGLARTINASQLTEAHLRVAEREYLRRQTGAPRLDP